MITQKALRQMILIKKSDSGPIAYNDRLREIDRLLKMYKFDEHELKLLEADVWNNLPQWRKKQIGKEKEDKRG